MAEQAISDERTSEIRQGLLGWFAVNARDLPWRRTRDPYAVLVSEIMLQQTQVDRVIPYYERFLAQFPTAGDLARAPTADVIRFWSGLGYNRRAVNLQRAAMVVAETLGGSFPGEPDDLRLLPGVGACTAGAVAAFAFERDVVFLDTNMRRVVNRLVFGAEPVSEAEVLAAARALLPTGKGWEWNQALIEFGALQCTARKPACIVCPLRTVCAAAPTIQTTLATRRTKGGAAPGVPFETTSRYFRGRIVEALRGLPPENRDGISLSQLGPQVKVGYSESDSNWLRGLVEGLQRDGLAVIAEDRPRYQVGEQPIIELSRVKLP